jgi:predicted PurR-regulated permease PerM
MTFLMTTILFLPFFFVGLSFVENVDKAIQWVESHRAAGLPPPPEWIRRIPLVGERLSASWSEIAPDTRRILRGITPFLKSGGLWLIQHSFDFAKGLFFLALSLLIMFFFYRDGEGLVLRIRGWIQNLTGDLAQHLVDVVGATVKSVVYGILGTALAQGIVSTLGFWIAGIPSAVLLGLLTFVLSLVPIGPPLVWGGAAVWLFSNHQTGWGIFMIVYGAVIISGVDNVVKPYLISRGSKLPFVCILLGVLGGVAAFGFIGVFLGPTLLAAGYSLLQEIAEHRDRKREAGSETDAASVQNQA